MRLIVLRYKCSLCIFGSAGLVAQASQLAEKVLPSFISSEAEESLFELKTGKERYLGAQRSLE
jgi:hypothetical protein